MAKTKLSKTEKEFVKGELKFMGQGDPNGPRGTKESQ